MPVSGSTNYSDTTGNIINDAYNILTVYGASEAIDASDYDLALRILNRMMKAWQNMGLNLWLKKTAYIFLQKGQIEYTLKSTSTDHATLDYEETTLGAAAAIGATTLTVTSSSGMTIGDHIGIENDSNYLFWTTITNIPSTTSVIINNALTIASSIGLKVYSYTTDLDEPFNVYSAVREIDSEIDTPMNYLSYEEYFVLPNKTITGIPVSYNYDRQLGQGVIKVWPVPEDVDVIMKITMSVKVDDVDVLVNLPDYPQEWFEAITLNLAARLAAPFGKSSVPAYQTLKQDADAALDAVMIFDNEQGSLFLQPDFSGGR